MRTGQRLDVDSHCMCMYVSVGECCGREARMTSPRKGIVRSAGECRDILCHIALYLNSCLVDVSFSRMQ